MQKLGNGLGAGLCAGSAVGALEALFVLQSSAPSEYQAFGYAWTLYGLIGGAVGLGVGMALAVVARKMSAAMVWCLAFGAVVFPLGFVIGRYIVNKVVYAEQGVPMVATLALAAGLGVACLVGLWLGNNLLTKTPLKVLLSAKGNGVAWVGGLGLAWIFALSPAPGGQGTISPKKAQGAEFASRPNVIVILVDTLRADALSVYGAPADASPALAEFAKDGVVFEQFVTSASWTRASTASLLTSLAASTHTCEQKSSALPPAVVTLAEQMSEGGYATGGLPNNANVTASQGFGQGFDWFPYEPSYPMMARESTYALSMYQLVRKQVYLRLVKAKRVEDYYTPAEAQLSRAKAWVSANKAQKNFLFVHLMEPHDPYFTHPYDGQGIGRAEFPDPPPDWSEKLKGLYRGEVQWVDSELGTFFTDLKASGYYDDAVIVVTADHGEEFLEHGGWWHGTTLYDEQVHVPLIVKLPGNQYAGSRVPWQVRQVDVAPTVAALAGIDKHPTWQGDDLFTDTFDADLALSSPPPPPEVPDDGEQVVVEVPLVAWAPPTWANHPASRDALSEQDFEGYDLQSLRRGGKKLIEAVRVPASNPRVQPPIQYFDLMSDPAEAQNLAGSGSGDEAALRAAVQSMVEDRKAKSVGAVTHEMDDAEKCRLCALGYLSGDDCAACGGEAAPE